MMDEETMRIRIDDFNDEDEVTSDSNYWDYKRDNAEIVGFVTEINENGQYGREITIDTGKDERIQIPSLTVLKTKLEHVEVGDKIKIVCLGKVKNYYDFKVWVKKSDQQELEVPKGPRDVTDRYIK